MELLKELSILHNGVRYLLAGELGFVLGTGFRLGVKKSLKMPQNPDSQVHALLGGTLT